MYKTASLLAFILWIFIQSIYGQTRLGEWRDHLSYNEAWAICEAEDRIYCSSKVALFWYSKTDKSLHKMSRIQGLSDVGISAISYDTQSKLLLIGYQNGNLDLVNNNSVFQMPDIKRKTSLVNKEIHQIHFLEDKAYLACGFGIVVVSLSKREIADTYFIGEGGEQVEVFSITSDDQWIYAATAKGVFRADRFNPDLVNYSYWEKMNIPAGTQNFASAVNFAGNILVLADLPNSPDKVFRLQNSIWTEWDAGFPSGSTIRTIRVSHDKLFVCGQLYVKIFNSDFSLFRAPWSDLAADAMIDESGAVWIANGILGLTLNDPAWELLPIIPDGPTSNYAFHIVHSPQELLVAPGGFDQSWTALYRHASLYSFSQNGWNNWTTDSIRDVVNVAYNPANPSQIFAATYGYGILEFNNGNFTKNWNTTNSTLSSVLPSTGYCRTFGLAFDKQGNLWVTNPGGTSPISVKLAGGEWKSLAYASMINAPSIGEILINQYNHKWLVLPRGYGLFAFDDNGTPGDIRDDDYKKFSVTDDEGKTISNIIYDIAEDHDGNIWVGTASGPAVYYNPGAVFSDEGTYASQILIPRRDGSNLADPLLSTESITAIAVDGANRKWIGTMGSGAFLISPDGLKEILRFNTSNSPLLSNTINDITIHHKTGEIFFATPEGIVSWRGPATEGGDVFGKVYVFPNPIRETYEGDITITGLARNVNVKITDISGNLVYETTSLGGQAIWNGKNFDGRRVATGVYLVFCTNDDGSQTFITKLLFIH